MKRKEIIMLAALAGWLACVGSSCTKGSGGDESGEEGRTMSVSLRVANTGPTSVTATYEDGSDYENYIDISGGDYRVYFFTNDPGNDGNDTFITRFGPKEMRAVGGRGYTEYTLTGNVPDELMEQSEFKVVILANWPQYPVSPDGTLTIDQLCDYGKFDCMEDFVLGEGNLIPFYGVSEYKGVDFSEEQMTILPEPVNLIRAVAKIEVVTDFVFSEVVLHGYNASGYCAPKKVYTQDDYSREDSDGWYYVNDEVELHLVNGGANDEGATERTLNLIEEPREDDDDAEGDDGDGDEGPHVWYAYVPEFDNTSVSEEFAWLQVNVSGFEKGLEKYRIYFKDYSDPKDTTPAGEFDIGRNVLYRFTVTLEDEWLNVKPVIWENSFDNEYEFVGSADDGEDE